MIYVFFSIGEVQGCKSVQVDSDYKHVSQRERLVDLATGERIETPIRVVASADEFWGGPNSKPFKSKVYHKPTFGALLHALRKQIEFTGDQHHCYLESFEVVGKEIHPTIGTITLIALHCGS